MIGTLRKHSFGETQPEPKKRAPRKYDESRDQIDVVKWLRKRADWMVMRLENAQKRTLAQAARDKALGMHTGAPDLVLMYKSQVVFLEMKSEHGHVRPDQQQCHEELWRRGQTVKVAYGAAQAIKMLEEIENAKQ